MKSICSRAYEKIKSRSDLPFVIFSAVILLFGIFLTRFLIKMDDGNFLGISMNPDFTFLGWLTERYNTWTGRTVGELLLMFFIRHDIIWWKIANSAMIMIITGFWCRLSESFEGGVSLLRRKIFCCCGFFLMIVSCLNPAAFWFAGSFFYLWPCAGIVLTVSPLVFYILDGRLKKRYLILSFFAALLGTSQEQAAACCLAIYVILLTVVVINRRRLRFKAVLLLPLLPALLCSAFLFLAPGERVRTAAESLSGFERYAGMGLAEKLCCGLSVFFANSFCLSAFLMLLFVALLSLRVYRLSENKSRAKKLLVAFNVLAVIVCVVINAVVSVINRALPHMIIREEFKTGEYSASTVLLFVSGCVLLLPIAAAVAVLFIKDARSGFAVGLCCAAGFGCAMAMSFSPSIFQSGQRVFFFTEILIITACVMLLSSADNSRHTNRLYYAACTYAILSFVIDCFAFAFSELPIMG